MAKNPLHPAPQETPEAINPQYCLDRTEAEIRKLFNTFRVYHTMQDYEKMATLAWELNLQDIMEFKSTDACGRCLREALKKWCGITLKMISDNDLYAANTLLQARIQIMRKRFATVDTNDPPKPKEYTKFANKTGGTKRDFFGHEISSSAHKITLAIFSLKSFTLMQIAETTGLKRSNVETQLRYKVNKGYLTKTKKNKIVIYSLKPEYHSQKPI